MSTLVRPALAHPIAEDLDQLALQLLSLGWVLRAPAAQTTDVDQAPVLQIHAQPFGPPVAIVRLHPHHRIELTVCPDQEISVDDVEDLHQQLRQHTSSTPEAHRATESRTS